MVVNSSNDELKPLLGPKTKPWSFSENVLRMKNLKWRLWLNLMTFNLFGAINMAGVAILQSTQTSINYDGGLGASMVAITTIVSIPACFCFNMVHRLLGSRWCLVTGLGAQMVFIGANFYPKWAVMVPAAIISGLGSPLLYITSKLFIAQLAHRYCETQDQLRDQTDRVQSRMFMANILTYKVMISLLYPVNSYLLSDPNASETSNFTGFSTVFVPNANCGADYCNEGFESMFNRTFATESNSKTSVTITLTTLCVVFTLVALVILLVLVDSERSLGIPSSWDQLQESGELKDKKKISMAIMLHPKMLLLTPLFVVLLAGDAFWGLDFPSAFITCQLGIEYVGQILMWTGISGGASCLIFGSFNSEKFRKVSIGFSVLIQGTVLIFLLLWPLTSRAYVYLCLATIGWFIGSGIKLNLVPALTAVVFPNDLHSAFSVQHLWGAFGVALISGWSNWLCMYIKLYIILGILAVSLLGYIGLEWVLHTEKRRKQSNITIITNTVINNIEILPK